MLHSAECLATSGGRLQKLKVLQRQPQPIHGLRPPTAAVVALRCQRLCHHFHRLPRRRCLLRPVLHRRRAASGACIRSSSARKKTSKSRTHGFYRRGAVQGSDALSIGHRPAVVDQEPPEWSGTLQRPGLAGSPRLDACFGSCGTPQHGVEAKVQRPVRLGGRGLQQPDRVEALEISHPVLADPSQLEAYRPDRLSQTHRPASRASPSLGRVRSARGSGCGRGVAGLQPLDSCRAELGGQLLGRKARPPDRANLHRG